MGELMSGPCVICGRTNYAPSCGGPMICPKCDCGQFDAATVEQQAKIIARLTRENEALTNVLQATQGRIMNAKIDLGTGHTKAQVTRTLQGIIEFVDGALSLKEPAGQKERA